MSAKKKRRTVVRSGKTSNGRPAKGIKRCGKGCLDFNGRPCGRFTGHRGPHVPAPGTDLPFPWGPPSQKDTKEVKAAAKRAGKFAQDMLTDAVQKVLHKRSSLLAEEIVQELLNALRVLTPEKLKAVLEGTERAGMKGYASSSRHKTPIRTRTGK